MKLPAEIEKEYILQAVESYKTKGLPPLCNEDTMYKVVIDGEEFPPPAIAKYAFHHKFGEWPEEFDGGLDSDCFSLLESCGYKIISKSKVNERYLELEEFVFNHLMKKNKESGLTFSVRQRAGKDSELDHFIGTADSNYSGFSLWNIAVDKFLATDVIDFIFKEVEKDKFSISFQFIVNRSDDSEQNKATVMLGDLIKKELIAKGFETNLSKEGSAHYKIISALNPSEFDGRDDFIKGLDTYLEVYPVRDYIRLFFDFQHLALYQN